MVLDFSQKLTFAKLLENKVNQRAETSCIKAIQVRINMI